MVFRPFFLFFSIFRQKITKCRPQKPPCGRDMRFVFSFVFLAVYPRRRLFRLPRNITLYAKRRKIVRLFFKFHLLLTLPTLRRIFLLQRKADQPSSLLPCPPQRPYAAFPAKARPALSLSPQRQPLHLPRQQWN